MQVASVVNEKIAPNHFISDSKGNWMNGKCKWKEMPPLKISS